MEQFADGLVAAFAGLIAAGFFTVIRMLFAMRRDVRSFSYTIQAIAEIQPSLFKATRHQNAALREIGANGATERSDACIDEAEKTWNRLAVSKMQGETS